MGRRFLFKMLRKSQAWEHMPMMPEKREKERMVGDVEASLSKKRSCLQITGARAGVINMWDETPGLDRPFHRGLLRTSENPGIYIMIHNCIQN